MSKPSVFIHCEQRGNVESYAQDSVGMGTELVANSRTILYFGSDELASEAASRLIGKLLKVVQGTADMVELPASMTYVRGGKWRECGNVE